MGPVLLISNDEASSISIMYVIKLKDWKLKCLLKKWWSSGVEKLDVSKGDLEEWTVVTAKVYMELAAGCYGGLGTLLDSKGARESRGGRGWRPAMFRHLFTMKTLLGESSLLVMDAKSADLFVTEDRLTCWEIIFQMKLITSNFLVYEKKKKLFLMKIRDI